ncbi:MAG TPA: hypothetical protein VKW04_18795 [Planctomycetota bacterium]|nr:hypothetical protein [Planctomycetota bacterium]
MTKPRTEQRRTFPWVEILFLLMLACASAAFYTRMTAYWQWKRDEPTGQLGLLSWIWSLAAFGPFLILVILAPNPELAEPASRRARRGQLLMFSAIGVMFLLEAFLLTY